MRMKIGFIRKRQSFGGHFQSDLRFIDHLAHFADTLGALGLAPGMGKNSLGSRCTARDGLMHLAFANSVTITDVHVKP